MANTVDGLISGLSTTSLISQLMQVEAAPQQRLQNKVKTEQTVLASYQSVNTRLAALETAAAALANLDTWASAKATSSSTAISASASSGTSSATLTMDVKSLARGQMSTAVVASTGSISAGNSIGVSIDGGAVIPIDVTADPSAAGVVKAINDKGLSVKASLITTSTGETLMQLTSTKTGTANGFALTGLDAPVTTAIAPTNATVQVGTLGAGGFTVSSSTNTLTNLMPGLTLTVSRMEDGVEVGVTSDPDAVAAKFAAFVDATNNALAEMSKQAATGSSAASSTGTASSKGPLAGDSLIRSMSQKLLSVAGNGSVAYGSFKQMGVELTRDGKLTFDKAKFLTAVAADPAAVKTAAMALGDNVKSIAVTAQSMVKDTVASHNSTITSLNTQISSWDIRLATREAALGKTYANLEVMLGKLKNQSSWLAGQVSGLSSSGSE